MLENFIFNCLVFEKKKKVKQKKGKNFKVKQLILHIQLGGKTKKIYIYSTKKKKKLFFLYFFFFFFFYYYNHCHKRLVISGM